MSPYRVTKTIKMSPYTMTKYLHLSPYKVTFVKKMRKQNLIIDQLDKKFFPLSKELLVFNSFSGKWINSVRTTLNMSLSQLGKRLNIKRQNVKKLEDREAEGTITVEKLSEVAEAMDCRLVYAFIPKEGSIKKIIDKRIEEIARQIVLRTSQTMILEDQENSSERIDKSIREVADKIRSEMPKFIWD